MERRNFIKISALTGMIATLDACGRPDQKLIRFVPEEDLIPGIATWKPSVCTLCSAGCGLLVRVMEGDAEVVRHGQRGVMQMGLAKKLEGNPRSPINQGKLCARGHAGLQVLYNPDRITQPIKRTGSRGSGEFKPISWDDALMEVSAHLTALQSAKAAGSLAFLARPLSGQRHELIERFLKAFGAPPAVWYQPFDEAVLRRANLLSFGHGALPTIDLGRADYVLSFGADFLGTWNSPVAQSAAYGEMRQGRSGHRAKFVQVEARMSQTGANCDEWIACRPGTEGLLALGIAHVILNQKLAPQGAASKAGSLIAGWSAGLPESTPEAVEKQTGVSAAVITRIAHEIAKSGAATAIVGCAPLAHTNGLFNALAVNALEALVDSSKDPAPIMSFTPELVTGAGKSAASVQAGLAELNSLAQSALQGQPHAPQVLFLYEANPIFSAPPGTKIREAIAKVPYIVSLGNFIDETSAQADIILPDHAPLESWLDSMGESGSLQSVANLTPPAVAPLHDTRAMPDVLLGLAKQLGGDVAKALPFATYDAMLRAAYVPLRARGGSIDAKTDDDFWAALQAQGIWSDAPGTASATGSKSSVSASAAAKRVPMAASAPEFSGAVNDFPFYFLPYVSQSFGDGSLANLPWLQELPDVLTTAMWSSWVEINPKTGARLGIQQGDLVEIGSRQGKVRAPAVLSPGIAPDVVAMPVGQGHENFGRFASGRGANPLSILATATEHETGSLAWAATRVKIARIGGPEQARLTLFSGGRSGFPHEEEPR
ncbi:MAG TPA: molybdopterin-dependent oxidoreductase [Acidobacteriaceae bacterium]